MRAALVALLVALAPAGAPAAAEDITVGRGGDHRTLAGAVRASAFGDTLTILPGAYEASDLVIPHDLTIEGTTSGGQGVTISAPGAVAKGLLVPGGGVVLTVRNVTFEGARSPDRNGAGIRFEGADLLVEDVTFRGNENGILATGAPTGSVTIRRALFDGNGHGDGYSHGVYQSRGARFTVEDSRFVGTRIGHHVKSLAPLVVVTGSSFDDADGRASYAVDATGGGRLVVTYNAFRRRADAEQDTLVNYDTSRGGQVGDVSIEGNVIVTEKPGLRVLRNPEGAPVRLEGNTLSAEGRGSFRGTAAASRPAAPPVGEDPPGIDEAALRRLTPQQRRAVERMMREEGGLREQTPASPAPAALPQTGLLRPPSIAAPPGAVAAFRLVAVSEAQAGGPVTFGQVFEPGALAPGVGVSARGPNGAVPTQIDVKATHPDGSVRHAVVTLVAPQAIGSGQDYALVPGEGPKASEAPAAPALAPLTITIEGSGPDGAFARTVTTGDGAAPLWLDGPLVRERSEVHAVTPLLRLRVDDRAYADGARRTRLTIENHEAFAPGPRDHAYTVTVRDAGGGTVWASGPVRHYRHAGWSAVLPGGEARHVVQHDPRALIASGAFPPLDLSVPVAAEALSTAPHRSPRPGERSLLTAYMPTSGGRREIGPVTGWTAQWLKTQDPRARAAVLRAAEEGLTLPWHFEDRGRIVTGDARPRFWADPRGAGDAFDAFPEDVWSEAPGGWTVDLAHKPDLAFPAYLMTGERVFARALAHEAAYAVTGVWPDLRGETGDRVTRTLQTRTAAWSLRALGNAAWALPDKDPYKAVFARTLARNLAGLSAQLASSGGALGAMLQDTDDVAPWQQDFVVLTLAQEARRGTPHAADALRAMVPWLRSRMAGGIAYASAPRIVVRKGGAILNAERSLALTDAPDPNADGADGYLSVLIAALSAAYEVTGEESLADAARAARARGARLTDPGNRVGLVHEPQMGWRAPK